MKRLSWGDKGQERVENLLRVFLNHEQYPDEKLQASWEQDPGELYLLKVDSTTKKSLAELLNDNQPLYEPKKLSSAKNNIQNSLKQLELLEILEDQRKYKSGPEGEKLKLLLRFPFRNSNEIIEYFREKWDEFLDKRDSRDIAESSYNIIDSERIKINIQIECDANSEVVKTLLGTFLKLQELNPNSR
jgi:hypothetical protein